MGKVEHPKTRHTMKEKSEHKEAHAPGATAKKPKRGKSGGSLGLHKSWSSHVPMNTGAGTKKRGRRRAKVGPEHVAKAMSRIR